MPLNNWVSQKRNLFLCVFGFVFFGGISCVSFYMEGKRLDIAGQRKTRPKLHMAASVWSAVKLGSPQGTKQKKRPGPENARLTKQHTDQTRETKTNKKRVSLHPFGARHPCGHTPGSGSRSLSPRGGAEAAGGAAVEAAPGHLLQDPQALPPLRRLDVDLRCLFCCCVFLLFFNKISSGDIPNSTRCSF